MGLDKIACVDNGTPKARAGGDELASRYDLGDPADADVIVALGGDGFMLQTLHEHLGDDVTVFGMHAGTVGFLMNEYRTDDLLDRHPRLNEDVHLADLPYPLESLATYVGEVEGDITERLEKELRDVSAEALSMEHARIEPFLPK